MTRKAKHYRRHARQRAYERYDFDLSDSDLRVIEKRIRANDGITHMETQTNTRSKIAVDFQGEQIPVIYSRSTKAIVTVLPKEALYD